MAKQVFNPNPENTDKVHMTSSLTHRKYTLHVYLCHGVWQTDIIC